MTAGRGAAVSFATIGVVGAGTMGAGIAQLAVEHGHDVLLYDIDAAAIGRGRDRIADGLARRVAKRGLDDAAAAEATGQAMARLRDAATLEDVAGGAGLVVEATLERLELKRTVFAALDAAAAAGALLATNTSALSVSAIAAGTRRPERVLGLHFFNPAPVMPLVEVVAGEATDPAALDAVARLVASWGKRPVHVRDVPGFIVNRVNRPFTLEPLRILAAGEAGMARIDRAIEAAGFPMGPFALMDLVGVEVNLAVAVTLWEGFFCESRFRPSPVQRRLVEGGHLGRKTGRGFYRYDAAGSRLGPAPEFEVSPDGGLADEAIAERTVLAIINEAFHALGEGIASPGDIDLALELGARHPHGPFAWADRLGLDHVVRRLDELTASEGEHFRPAAALRQALPDG
ncbi:MAG: 3-hydroxyacyl-CoA dehydrogenase NAD-binding domain-containing protein [Candidatus Limnocylindrales bacterium]